MTYINIEQLFSAVKGNALTVCAVSRDCVSGFTTVSAQCAWSENDFIISAAEAVPISLSIKRNFSISRKPSAWILLNTKSTRPAAISRLTFSRKQVFEYDLYQLL